MRRFSAGDLNWFAWTKTAPEFGRYRIHAIVAIDAYDRAADILRFLRENFEEVEG